MKNSTNPENVYIAGRILAQQATLFRRYSLEVILEWMVNIAESDPDAVEWTEVDRTYAYWFESFSEKWSCRFSLRRGIVPFMLKYAPEAVPLLLILIKHNV